MKFVGLDKVIHHLNLLKSNYLSEFWIIQGRKGKGKSSSVRGLLKLLVENGFSYTENIGNDADILYIDDLARFFYKRDFMTKQNKEFMKFIRLVRGVYTLIIGTIQNYEDMDVDLRNDSDLIVCEVSAPGILLVPVIGVISIFPEFRDDREMRLQQLKKVQEALQASL